MRTRNLSICCVAHRWMPLLVIFLAPILSLDADEPEFRRHDINLQSTYSACCAIDVDRDGRLDIVCGGTWYEAPTWKPHFLREVQQIRSRYDDYSNLPLDVNGDGRLDLVSANYRSRSLYWVEQPEDLKTPWPRHVIAEPGPMETGRLADVDGDGKLDVLPNGTGFAAWWDVRQENGRPIWTRHDLPEELAGHGIGIGDIDGDGRLDLVGTRGWAQAPRRPRQERWIWRSEFQLPRDGSIPLAVLDVDRDGDADLVWGRGHATGLYWLEQNRDDAEHPWRQHAIDTSWSQPHCLVLADMNGDKHLDVVAGKRYMGHDGKDPGEYDPLGIYWYEFQPATRSWQRHTIHEGRGVGFGLDSKVVDLDQDGDLDVLATGRSGLYWLENIGKKELPKAPPLPQPQVEDHTDLTVYPAGRSGRLEKIDGPVTWALRRQDILHGMQAAMGRLPGSHRRVPLDIQIESRESTEHYERIKLSYQAEPNDRVPALLLIPKRLDGPAPAMLCLHQTTQIGKGEPAGLGGLKPLHYAHELAERGYVCLVPDYPSFGDYKYTFDNGGTAYHSGSMKAIWNNLRAVDLLQSRSEVHPDRIGVIGHSLGGHNSLFTAAFDLRIRAVVTSCGFTAFHDYYGGKLKGWTSQRYMPRINDVYKNDPDRVPFDFHEVLAAIAPRAIFVSAPQGDGNFAVDGVRKVLAAVQPVYKQLGAPDDRLQVAYPDTGHTFPEPVRMQAYQWLDKQLAK